ncbi:MAG: DUF1214 domain-containing protein [Myxococcota bacterium]|nr:DUF1214 domain-containing protein [Myxococcota bacterium]
MEQDPADARIMDGTAWETLCATLLRASQRVMGDGVPDSPRERAEGFRYLTRFLAAGIVSCVSHDDPDYPVFGRMIDYTMPWGLDNPDCLYLYAPLRGGAEYRIWGNLGSANHIDFQVNFGHYANGDISTWGTIASGGGMDLETDADGRLELYVGGEERAGNWLPSREDAEFMLVRQYFDDWEAERPADLLIERVGAEYPIPPPTTDAIAGRLAKLERWIEQGGALWENMSRGFLSMEPNSLVIHMPEAAGERSGMRGQAYGMGHFRCEADEAVLIEFSPPRCIHWGMALANGYWECVEYASRQSSLNRAQATLDDDGVMRAVIAHDDPGVPNWLDPGGNIEGTLSIRFLHAERAPEISFQCLPLDRVREALPAETPLVDARARGRVLEGRRRALLRRFRE